MSGARGGEVRIWAVVRPHVIMPPRHQGAKWPLGSHTLGIAARWEVPGSPHVPRASSSGSDALAGLIWILQRFPY